MVTLTHANYRHREAIGIAGVFLLAMVMLLIVCCRASDHRPTVLVITRDQSDTTSLNPSRLSVTSEMALRGYREAYPGGVPIRHVFITYKGDDGNGVAAAEEYLRTDRNVLAVIGDIGSPTTRLVAEFAEKHKLVHLSFFATDDAIFQKHPWSISYRSTLEQEHRVLLDILQDRLKAQRLVLVKTNNQTINPRFVHFKSRVTESGLTIQSEWLYERNIYDFREDLQSVDWAGMDALVIMLAADQTEHYLQQLQLAGIRLPVVVTTPSLQPEAFADMASIALELYGLMPSAQIQLADSGDQKFQYFKEGYQTAMGNNRFDTGGFWAYDGFLLLHELLQEARTAEELRKALMVYKGNRLVGSIRFNEFGILLDTTFTPIRIVDGSYESLSP
jgi:ABC-type branched-subunit amino acid transport system substrate-binding protein